MGIRDRARPTIASLLVFFQILHSNPSRKGHYELKCAKLFLSLIGMLVCRVQHVPKSLNQKTALMTIWIYINFVYRLVYKK